MSSPGDAFFETPPLLLTLIAVGRWMENIAKGRTSNALKHLLAMQVQFFFLFFFHPSCFCFCPQRLP